MLGASKKFAIAILRKAVVKHAPLRVKRRGREVDIFLTKKIGGTTVANFGKESFISGIGVSKNYKGLGLASRLFKKAAFVAEKKGAHILSGDVIHPAQIKVRAKYKGTTFSIKGKTVTTKQALSHLSKKHFFSFQAPMVQASTPIKGMIRRRNIRRAAVTGVAAGSVVSYRVIRGRVVPIRKKKK